MSLNYQFSVDLAARYAPPPGRFLDFGCGMADVAALAQARGFEAYGVDTYLGIGATSENLAVATAKLGDRIAAIRPGEPTPFEASYFDIVVSNQVFEHVENLAPVRDEIARILKPSGVLVALMPTYETLWEGHIKMPFAHRFQPGSLAQRRALTALYALGFGIHRRPNWVEGTMHTLTSDVFYRTVAQYVETLAPSFTLVAQDEPAWVQHRLANRMPAGHLSTLAKSKRFAPLFRQAVRRSAGAVLIFTKR